MTQDITRTIENHPVVSHDEWLSARTALLAKEKEFTRLRDDLSRQRRELPWEEVHESYRFETPAGSATLAELFGNRSQLVVYHFMFNPVAEVGCVGCSFWADSFNDIGAHLNARDVAFVAISRAPLARLELFKKRMGWSFNWVSSAPSDFNYDLGVSFTPEVGKSGAAFYNYAKTTAGEDLPGISVFYKDESGAVFHTYSCYARGIEEMNAAYHYLDLVPKGRDEEGLKFTSAWVRHHDRYED